MHRLRLFALSASICLACGAAHAQTANRASALAVPRSGPGYTNGWDLMSDDERHDYKERMMAMTNVYECRAFVDDHHRKMVERAKEDNADIPPPPRYDVCDGLAQ